MSLAPIGSFENLGSNWIRVSNSNLPIVGVALTKPANAPAFFGDEPVFYCWLYDAMPDVQTGSGVIYAQPNVKTSFEVSITLIPRPEVFSGLTSALYLRTPVPGGFLFQTYRGSSLS